MMPESVKYWPKIFLKPILRTLHRSARGFLAASQREGAGLEKDLGALVSYAVQDAFGFPVVDVPPQGPLRDLGAFLDVPEICTAFGLQGYERQGLDGLHVHPEVNVLHLG